MKQDEVRRKLIDGTIHAIAREGLDKATTKQIGLVTDVNEAYIYRCFADKEDLLVKTFASLDEELVLATTTNFSLLQVEEIDFELRCWAYFHAIWKFLLGNKAKCLAFVQYYYSPYFTKYSAEDHKKRFRPLVEKLQAAFREEANVWMILNHDLTTMLSFAVKVFDDEVPDDEDTAEHVFRLVYASTRQYFKEQE